MASGKFVTIKLMRTGQESPWGFRLQGGKEFQLPLSVIKVANGSLSEQAGLQAGDIIVKISGLETESMRHKEAQDAIGRAGNYLELYIERGFLNTWKPSVTPVGDLQQGGQVYTKTSLEKSPQNTAPIGSGHNSSAKPFASQNRPALVHKQYNSPVNLYSEKNIEETLNAHSQVLATGATGINFMRPDAPVNKESAVYQMIQEEQLQKSKGYSSSPDLKPVFQEKSPIKSVSAPIERPNTEGGQADNANKNICGECERLIIGVFVRINNRSLHAECFRCATCGTSLKNVGYFNINDKLYCDIHAKQVKSFLGNTPTLPIQSIPTPVGNIQNTASNGYQNITVSNENRTVSQTNTTTNGFGSYQPLAMQPNGGPNLSPMKKYSPVSPPTAPKPFTNSNQIYVGSQAPLMTETSQTTSSCKMDWPPSTGNVVTYRETTKTISERPGSCYSSLPFASLSLNQNESNTLKANSLNPNTANYTSSVQTNSQTTYAPAPPGVNSNMLPQTNFSAGTSTNTSRQWTSSNASNLNKSTFSDSRSTPKRGRGKLQSQLTGGVIPFCGYCSQNIRGQYIMALNSTFCPAHFICANTLCKKSLEENGFIEENGRLYCSDCFDTHFAPNCAKCNQRIKGDCLNALDRPWHPNCFTCAHCKVPFGNSSFYLEDAFPYCERDWNDLFTTKCVGCGFPIAAGDRWVEALNQNYHSNCFRCTVCKCNLEGQSFFAKANKPYCRTHAR